MSIYPEMHFHSPASTEALESLHCVQSVEALEVQAEHAEKHVDQETPGPTV